MREDMKAVAQELGLAEPPTVGAGAPPANETPRPVDDNRYDPHPVEMKWFERWQSNPALYASDPASSFSFGMPNSITELMPSLCNSSHSRTA